MFKTIKGFAKGCKEGFIAFGHTITILVNTLLLTIVYFVGVGLTTLIVKLMGKKMLNLKRSKQATYWKEFGLKKKPIDAYYRQF